MLYSDVRLTPIPNTAIPKCPMVIPQKPAGVENSAVSLFLRLRKRSRTPWTVVVITHTDNAIPRAARTLNCPIRKGTATPTAKLVMAAQWRRLTMLETLSFFQRASAPIPIATAVIASSGRNMALKYGAPTDSFAIPSESSTSG